MDKGLRVVSTGVLGGFHPKFASSLRVSGAKLHTRTHSPTTPLTRTYDASPHDQQALLLQLEKKLLKRRQNRGNQKLLMSQPIVTFSLEVSRKGSEARV